MHDPVEPPSRWLTRCLLLTIQVLYDDYSGSCTRNDGDDGDHAATASNSGGDMSASPTSSGGGGSGLSSGAKAGIAIGVIAGVAIIAAAAYFLCCQLRRG